MYIVKISAKNPVNQTFVLKIVNVVLSNLVFVGNNIFNIKILFNQTTLIFSPYSITSKAVGSLVIKYNRRIESSTDWCFSDWLWIVQGSLNCTYLIFSVRGAPPTTSQLIVNNYWLVQPTPDPARYKWIMQMWSGIWGKSAPEVYTFLTLSSKVNLIECR